MQTTVYMEFLVDFERILINRKYLNKMIIRSRFSVLINVNKSFITKSVFFYTNPETRITNKNIHFFIK